MISHFKIKKGIELYGQATVLAGTSVPGGTADTDAAQIGSIYLRTNGTVYTKTGVATWNNIQITALPYDLAFYIPTTPYIINSTISGYLSPRSMIITAGVLNIAKCNVSPISVNTVFDIKLQGVQVATVTFTVGSNIGTIVFTLGSTISIVVGDILTISTTGTIDNTIAGIGITLVGISAIV